MNQESQPVNSSSGISEMTKPSIGIGLAALGRPGYINLGHAEDLNSNYGVSAMKLNAHAVLDAAWESGIRYFDAARSYGRAEEFLSEWLRSRRVDPDEVTVGSKWGYTYTAAWRVTTPEGVAHEVKRHELKVLQSQYRTSFKFLNEYLDLYQIHSATLDSGVLDNAEVLECLNGLRKAGTRVGLSVSGANQSETVEKAMSIRFDGDLLFSSVQATWNLLETSAGPALQAAHDAGMKVIVKESLANGRLTAKNQASEFQSRRELLSGVASELDTTMDALAIAAVLSQPWVSTVLMGAATVEHLQSNLRAREIEWSEELAVRLNEVSETPNSYWVTRSGLAWN